MIKTLHATCFRSMAAHHRQLHERFMCSDPSEGIYLTFKNKEPSLIMTAYIYIHRMRILKEK